MTLILLHKEETNYVHRVIQFNLDSTVLGTFWKVIVVQDVSCSSTCSLCLWYCMHLCSAFVGIVTVHVNEEADRDCFYFFLFL